MHTGEPEGQQYVDLGGPAYLGSLTQHVFESIAFHGHFALHVRVLAGREPHHIVETQFKAFARAFRDAVALDPRETGIPSTKGRSVSRAQRRRPRLRLGQPALRRARRRARRCRGDAHRRLRRRAGRRRTARARGRRLRRLHGRACAPSRASGSSAAGWPAADRCSASASACRCSSRAASSTASRPRAATSGPASSSGSRRRSCRTWAGTPSRRPAGTALFAGVEDERFYFVHSYGVRDWTLVTNDRTRAPLVTWAEHGGDRFVAAVENGPLCATQFHPEKSGDAGAALLRNWVARRLAMSKERAQRRAEREPGRRRTRPRARRPRPSARPRRDARRTRR